MESTAAAKGLSPLAKGLMMLFGAPVVLSIGFFVYFESTGESRMTYVCNLVAPGMAWPKLKNLAQEYKLGLPDKEQEVVILSDARSYGRHTCKVTLDGGVVKSASYSLAD